MECCPGSPPWEARDAWEVLGKIVMLATEVLGMKEGAGRGREKQEPQRCSLNPFYTLSLSFQVFTLALVTVVLETSISDGKS